MTNMCTLKKKGQLSHPRFGRLGKMSASHKDWHLTKPYFHLLSAPSSRQITLNFQEALGLPMLARQRLFLPYSARKINKKQISYPQQSSLGGSCGESIYQFLYSAQHHMLQSSWHRTILNHSTTSSIPTERTISIRWWLFSPRSPALYGLLWCWLCFHRHPHLDIKSSVNSSGSSVQAGEKCS